MRLQHNTLDSALNKSAKNVYLSLQNVVKKSDELSSSAGVPVFSRHSFICLLVYLFIYLFNTYLFISVPRLTVTAAKKTLIIGLILIEIGLQDGLKKQLLLFSFLSFYTSNHRQGSIFCIIIISSGSEKV